MAKALTSYESDALLQEIKERFTEASDYWRDVRNEGKKDMLCVAGKPWEAMDPSGLEQRAAANRPHLALDELSQYSNQSVNDVRANPIAIKYSPIGNGANDKTAELYSDKTREIEYRSTAQIPYTTAFQNAVERSYGFCRLTTKYESDTSMNQELWIEEIPNPDQVLPDPAAIRPDSSDMTYCFVFTHLDRKEFTRKYPKASITEFSNDVMQEATDWFVGDKVQVAEYWKIKTTMRTLLMVEAVRQPAVKGQPPTPMQPPVPVFKDELSKAQLAKLEDRIVATREVEEKAVCQYLTNGVEILKTTEWKGKYIPIASCYGKVIYVDDGAGAKRQILSMTRLARDPYMLYCYYRTCEAELVGMTPKFPYFAYEGQLSADELTNLQKSLHEPVAVIMVRPTVPGLPATQPLGFPARQPYEPPIQGLELGAEAARRAIQASMGSSPLPTQAQRHNEKSGVALKQIESAQQLGSFHFVDHYKYMVRHMGVMIEDIFDKVYDTARDIGVRKANDTSNTVRINDPAAQNPSGQTGELSTKGDHLVTVSTGPSFESEREASSDFADTLVGNPQLLQALGPKAPKLIALAIKLKMGGNPTADEMVQLLDPQPANGAPDPKQLQQQMGEMQQKLQQAAQMVQQLQQAVQTDQVKYAAQGKIADAANASRERIADADRAAKIEIARITAAKQSADAQREDMEEAIALGHQQQFDAQQAAEDRAHELGMAGVNHQQQLEQGQQAQQGQADLAAQGHQQALEQQAAQPQPEAGA